MTERQSEKRKTQGGNKRKERQWEEIRKGGGKKDRVRKERQREERKTEGGKKDRVGKERQKEKEKQREEIKEKKDSGRK